MKGEPIPDKELILAVQSGDRSAFRRIYERYCPVLYPALQRMVQRKDVSEELLQIVFVKLWENRNKIDPQRPLKPYLNKIAEHALYDYFRKQALEHKLRQQVQAQQEATHSPIESWFYEKENRAILEAAMALLPPRRRQIFQLCKIEGYTYEQISQAMGISPSTVNDHMVKAAKKIRAHLACSLN